MFEAKIKVKVLNKKCTPSIIGKGDWIDLKAAKSVKIEAPTANREHVVNGKKVRDINFLNTLVPLGVIIKVPDGCEAVMLPRSSSMKHYGFIQSNSEGVIDHSYCGPTDEWKLPITGITQGYIAEGDRVCQFRIQLSQKATIWQKIKWFFSNGVKIEIVDWIDGIDRGGFGSTKKQ